MAQSSRTNHVSARPSFWQVLLMTVFVCLRLASEGSAAPAVGITPQIGLTYNAVQGASNPPNQTITVSRTSSRKATLSASDNASWLSVSPATNSMTTSAQLTVAANTQGLIAGTYNVTITIKVGTWYTATVPVKVVVSPPTQPPPSTTSSVNLAWNAVAGTTVSGYKVYIGQVPSQYAQTIDVGNVTSSTVSGLTIGRTYYFVVTSYNNVGESTPSNEVSKTIQ